MERRRRRPANEDPLAKRLREMKNSELLSFAFRLSSVFPHTRTRKADIRLARKEVLRRMRKFCIIGNARNVIEGVAKSKALPNVLTALMLFPMMYQLGDAFLF